MGVGGLRHVQANLAPVKTRYRLHRMLGSPEGQSGEVRENSLPTGFDPRTTQSVACLYIDWTIQARIKRHSNV
jgi:hypothetical protein